MKHKSNKKILMTLPKRTWLYFLQKKAAKADKK